MLLLTEPHPDSRGCSIVNITGAIMAITGVDMAVTLRGDDTFSSELVSIEKGDRHFADLGPAMRARIATDALLAISGWKDLVGIYEMAESSGFVYIAKWR